jgi:hypothetical protein
MVSVKVQFGDDICGSLIAAPRSAELNIGGKLILSVAPAQHDKRRLESLEPKSWVRLKMIRRVVVIDTNFSVNSTAFRKEGHWKAKRPYPPQVFM